MKRHWEDWDQEELKNMVEHWRQVAHNRLHKIQAIECIYPDVATIAKTKCKGIGKCPLIKNLDSLTWDYLYEEESDGKRAKADADAGSPTRHRGSGKADLGAEIEDRGVGEERGGDDDDAGWDGREV